MENDSTDKEYETEDRDYGTANVSSDKEIEEIMTGGDHSPKEITERKHEKNMRRYREKERHSEKLLEEEI